MIESSEHHYYTTARWFNKERRDLWVCMDEGYHYQDLESARKFLEDKDQAAFDPSLGYFLVRVTVRTTICHVRSQNAKED